MSKASVYVRFALAVIVVCVASIVAFVNNDALNRSLESAANTASTEFSPADDYDLGEVMVLDGWVTTRSSRYSSTKSTTGYDVFVVFSARDGACVAMLNVSSSDGDVFEQVKDYADDSSRAAGSLSLNAVGTPIELPDGRADDLRDRVATIEENFGIVCTPVYYDFEYVSSSSSDYEAGKSSHVDRKNYAVLMGGVGLAVLIVIGALRRLVLIRRAEKEAAQVALTMGPVGGAPYSGADVVPQPSNAENAAQSGFDRNTVSFGDGFEESTTILSPDGGVPGDVENTTLLTESAGWSSAVPSDPSPDAPDVPRSGTGWAPSEAGDGFEELTTVLSQGNGMFSTPSGLPDEAVVRCVVCGADLSPDAMYCTNCGAKR